MLCDGENLVVEEVFGDGGGSFVVVAVLDAATLGIDIRADDDDGKSFELVVFDVVVVVVVVVVEVVLEVAVLVISN